jgi:signal transduction histidine kinase
MPTVAAKTPVTANDLLQYFRKRSFVSEPLLESAYEADERLNQSLALLAHEVRNPLAAMQHALLVLRQQGGNSVIRLRAQEILERQVRHLSVMTEQLLDLSRIDHGKISLTADLVDLACLVQEATADHAAAFASAGIRLSVDLPDGTATVRGDRTRLVQVIGNLLQNAVKYTPRGGEVMVRIAKDELEERVHVSVRDTGIGIPKPALPHIFEAFTQARYDREREKSGLGLGLALVKKLVQLHGGDIAAHSDGPGQGSEFTFWLSSARPNRGRPPYREASLSS